MSQQINLYEARLRPRRELATGRNLGAAGLALLALVAGTAVWVGMEAARKTEAAAAIQKQLGEQQVQLTALSKAVAERRVSPALAADLDKARATLAAREEVMETLESGRQGSSAGFSAIMSGFARQAQKDLWLTSFVVARGGEDIEIRGRVLDPSGLPAYVQRLGSEPVFQGRRFSALEMIDRESTDEKAELSAKASPGAIAPPAALKPPRFVEFVLRSEHAAGKAAVSTTGRGGRGS
ncbi:MAG: hypothetical protein QMB52_12405 [Propionivibrio sp.]